MCTLYSIVWHGISIRRQRRVSSSPMIDVGRRRRRGRYVDISAARDYGRVSTLQLIILSPFTVVGRSAAILLLLLPQLLLLLLPSITTTIAGATMLPHDQYESGYHRRSRSLVGTL